MNIHHYHFGKDGGAERFFLHLAEGLCRRGISQTAVIRKNRTWKHDLARHAKVIESDFRNLSFDRLTLPLRVKRMARIAKPDALMSWAPRASLLMPAYGGCIKLSRLGDYPRSLRYFRNTDILVCNTPLLADHVRKKLGWDRGVEVISNFTDTTVVAPANRADYATPPNAPLVMAMGRFVQRKRFHILLHAIAKVPDVYLWLAGDGEDLEANQRLAQDLKVENRVRFLGWQTDTRPFVAAADIFVMPSSHEPLGNVIFEAWAQNIPVISSRSEGPTWFMKDGENGLLVDIDDTAGFASSIKLLIENPQLGRSIVMGGQASLHSQFSEESVASSYIDLFSRKP